MAVNSAGLSAATHELSQINIVTAEQELDLRINALKLRIQNSQNPMSLQELWSIHVEMKEIELLSNKIDQLYQSALGKIIELSKK